MSLQEILVSGTTFTVGVGAILPVVWNSYWFIQLEKVSQKIRKAEEEYDAVEGNCLKRTGSLVVQSQLDKMIENNRKPILRKLERLKQERDFIKDKLMFVKNSQT